MAPSGQFIAITLHRIPRKEVCGVVILARQEDESWAGKCSKCGEWIWGSISKHKCKRR